MTQTLQEKIRWQLHSMLAIFILIALVGGVVVYRLLDTVGSEAVSGTQKYIALDEDENEAEIAFHREVQEWKDLLLRGHDAQFYQKYYGALHSQYDAIETHLNRLSNKLTAIGLATSSVAHIQQAHQALSARYEQALQQFPLEKNPANAQRIDALLRDADRSLNEEFDALRHNIQQQVFEQTKTVNAQVQSRHFLELYFVLSIMVVLFPLVDLLGFNAIGRMTKRMQEERERFSVILNSIGDGVVVTDLQGRVEYLNPVSVAMTGWTLNEARGKLLSEIFNLINETSREAVRNPIEAVLREGHTIGLSKHTVLISRSGVECAIDDSAAPLRDQDGNLSGVVLVFHDDTTQRQAQQHLLESEAQMRVTLQYAPDAVFICEPDGRIEYANSNAIEILGYSDDELSRMNIFDLVPEDWRATYYKGAQKVLSNNQRQVFEIRLLTKDGVKIPMELNTVKLPTGHVYGSCRDIRDRKLAEAATLFSRQQLDAERVLFKAIFDSAPIGIWMLGIDGKVKFINRTFCDAVGIAEEQFKQAQHYSEVLPAEISESCMRSDRECLAQDTPHFSAEWLPFVDGKKHLLEITKVKLLDAQKNVTGLIGLAVDVSELRRSDAMLGGQKKILELIASGTPLSETLDALVQFTESQSPEMIGSIILLEPDGIHMKHGAAPSLPDLYTSAIDGAPIGANVGSCGTAIYRKEPVYVEDIATDPLWADYKHLALPHGLRACWSTPIFDLQHRVVGTFAMYYRHPGLPQLEHLQLIETATQMASIAITRHQAESTLRKSEEAFRTLFESSHDAIMTSTPEDGFLAGNQAAIELFGCRDTQEFISLSPAELSPVYQADGRRSDEKAQEMMHLALNQGTHIFEWTHKRVDGTEFFADVLLNPIEIDGKKMLHATVRDITQRKHAELQEQQRVDQLEAIYLLSEAVSNAKSLEQVYEEAMYFMLRLLKADRVAILLFDKDGVIHFKAWRGLSDTYRQTFDGYAPWTQDTLNPQPLFISDIEHDATFTYLRQAIINEGVAALGAIPLVQHGRLLGNFQMYFDAPHEFSENETRLAFTIASHVAYAIDRKFAEQQFVDIFEFSPDAIVMTDMHGMIKLVNRQAENLFAYAASELIGQGIDVLIPQDRSGERRDMRQRFLASAMRPRPLGQTQRKDLRGITKNGRIFPVEISLSPLESTSGMLIAAAVRDVSSQRLAMEQLRDSAHELEIANAQVEEERARLADRVMERTAQLLFANKAKDSFLATMSHEIRTPLGGLLGMMELLGLSKLDNEQSEMLHVAQNSGKSLLRIVDDILDWSKIEAGKLELVPRVVSVTELLKSVSNTYAHIASAKGIALHIYVDEKLSAAHLFDALRLSQILNNFTSNAIKFTERGSVEIGAQRMAQHEGNEEICFSVKDSGIGIDPEQQSRLFQHYEQASNDTARMYGGTGLGLAICRRLAELMEGTIRLESAPGLGTTFYFTVNLPVANSAAQNELRIKLASRKEQAVAADITTLFSDGRKASVLVVDDHPVNRLLLKQQLEQLGIQVDVAESGVVGLSLWWTGFYDMVITDCHMPEIDGYEMTRSIREIEKHDGRQPVTIIAWTANVLAEEEGLCHTAGMNDLLTKPTDLPNLRAMLLKWLDRHDMPSTLPISGAAKNALASEAAIDFSVLRKFASSQAAQMEILQEFSLHNRSDIANLSAALKDGKPAAVARSAHRVKGACRMVGATELSLICERIEHAAKQDDMSAAQLAGTELDDALARIEACIAQFSRVD